MRSTRKNGPLEENIEEYLRIQTERRGGLCFKWVSPGNPGVPDRILLFAGIEDLFVETKKLKGKLRSAQKIQIRRLGQLGRPVFVLNTKERIDEFFAGQFGEQK